jgi:hypothetical protein
LYLHGMLFDFCMNDVPHTCRRSATIGFVEGST